MKKITLLAILFSIVTYAQEPVIKNLGDFNKVKVYNGLTVNLIKSSKNKLEITGKNSDLVSIKNSNGTLKIRLDFPKIYSKDELKINLYYAKKLQVIDANEGAIIISKFNIKQSQLEVKVQEGAEINLDITVEYLKVKAISGGKIILKGKATNQDIIARSGANYRAFNLKSDRIEVVASSGAEANITAKKFLDAKVRFGGQVYYEGKPEIIKTNKFIGGRVKQFEK